MKAILLSILLALPIQAAGESGFTMEGSQLVFFSVLESLYRDGVSQDTVKALLPEGEHEMTHSFIYACPLCHPAFEAFRLYASRRPFYGQKGDDIDTLGKGLNAAQVAQLKSADPNQRRAAKSNRTLGWPAPGHDALERRGASGHRRETQEIERGRHTDLEALSVWHQRRLLRKDLQGLGKLPNLCGQRQSRVPYVWRALTLQGGVGSAEPLSCESPLSSVPRY
jgi:hypothetical protein